MYRSVTARPSRAVRSAIGALAVVAATVDGAAATTYSFSLTPAASIPLYSMRDTFGPSPSVTAAFRVDRPDVGYRISFTGSMLRATVDALPDSEINITPVAVTPTWEVLQSHVLSSRNVPSVSLVADIILPGTLGIRRLSLFGGIGVGYRKLVEGRAFTESITDITGTETRMYRVRRGFDTNAIDAVAQAGLDFALLRHESWGVSTEVSYTARYAAVNPAAIGLDLRVDESVRVGIVVSRSVGAHHIR